MAYITKTFLFPVPTEWMGQEQDETVTGLATYHGPANLTIWYKNNPDGTHSRQENNVFDTEELADRPVPIDVTVKTVDANADPFRAACLMPSCVAMPNEIRVLGVGPTDRFEDAIINDPCHLFEAYDMNWAHFRFDDIDGQGDRWGEPRFSHLGTEHDDDVPSFGWDWVRDQRNSLLAASDSKIVPDAPAAQQEPWRQYRQQLRDLPTAWAGVGSETRLIRWPLDPDEQATANAQPAEEFRLDGGTPIHDPETP
jgi:hypothetical protein